MRWTEKQIQNKRLEKHQVRYHNIMKMHSWFAWYPIKIRKKTIWLETVRRHWTPTGLRHFTGWWSYYD